MPYRYTFGPFFLAAAGKTLTSRVMNANNTQLGSTPAASIYDRGNGAYVYTTSAMPDGHEGWLEILEAGAVVGGAPISPREAENRLASSEVPDNAAIAAIQTAVDTEVAAILTAVDTEVAAIKNRTDLIPDSPAAVGSAMTLTSAERNSVADTILDRENGVEPGITLRQALRGILSSAVGKLLGALTNTVRFRNPADSKDRITAQIDGLGNREAVTLDLT